VLVRLLLFIMLKLKFPVEETMMTQRGSRGIALLFL